MGNMDNEFIINKQGAKIFLDIEKQPKLVIPVLKTNKEKGIVLDVLSVGIHKSKKPIITFRKNKEIVAYVLPLELKEWVMGNVSLAQTGINLFPCEVEFGYISSEDKYYAEFKI